jgi:hypothetical protein
MASVFDGKNISYGIEKLHDYIHNSGSGVTIAPNAAKIIVGALEGLERKMKEHNSDPKESPLPETLYTARELQKYVNRQASDIPNAKAARVFVKSLDAGIKELEDYEREMEA